LSNVSKLGHNIDRLGSMLRNTASSQIKDYQHRFSSMAALYDTVFKDLIVDKYDIQQACITAHKFFGKDTINFVVVICGWGILLLFAADQAVVQTQLQSPYPPFGLVTLTVLNIGAFLMLIGIYNSATLVSANNELRRFIHKQAFESRLLSLIGHAEMEKEIQRTVTKITLDLDTLEADKNTDLQLDEDELKKYVDLVVREVKHKDINKPR
jgi:hypothetical protein